MTTATTNEQTILATVTVGEAGLFGLNAKVDKLNKRAEKHGMNKVVVRVVGTTVTQHEKTGLNVSTYSVEIEGCAPRINGWYLAARIENNDIIGTVVRIVPGKFADEDYSGFREYDFGSDVCDHCGTCRRRNDVFVLKNDDGFVRVIGRNCLADYLRCEDAAAFGRYAEFCDEVTSYDDEFLSEFAGDEGFGGRGCRPVVGITEYLTAVQTCIRRLGWTSRSAAYDNPGLTASADDAFYLLFGSGKGHDKFVKDFELYASDGDADLAGRAAKWASELTTEQTDKNDYLDTVCRIAKAGQTDDKLAGFAASIIGAYQRELGYAAERAERAANSKEKAFVGCIKERLKDRVVKVVRVRYFESDFGTKTIVAMEMDLADGTVAPLTWFASKSLEFVEGADYNFTGTVKSHKSDDKYGPQTMVNRCKLTEV